MTFVPVNITDHRRVPKDWENPVIWVDEGYFTEALLKSKEFASSGEHSREVYVRVYPGPRYYKEDSYFGHSKKGDPCFYEGDLIHIRYIQLKSDGAALKDRLGSSV